MKVVAEAGVLLLETRGRDALCASQLPMEPAPRSANERAGSLPVECACVCEIERERGRENEGGRDEVIRSGLVGDFFKESSSKLSQTLAYITITQKAFYKTQMLASTPEVWGGLTVCISN